MYSKLGEVNLRSEYIGMYVLYTLKKNDFSLMIQLQDALLIAHFFLFLALCLAFKL